MPICAGKQNLWNSWMASKLTGSLKKICFLACYLYGHLILYETSVLFKNYSSYTKYILAFILPARFFLQVLIVLPTLLLRAQPSFIPLEQLFIPLASLLPSVILSYGYGECYTKFFLVETLLKWISGVNENAHEE